MALPESMAAYEDCYKVWREALSDPKGIRVLMPNQSEAKRYQMRMQTARRLLRDESRRVYTKVDFAYGKSEFDHLKVTTRQDTEGEWWVYLTPHGQEIVLIEGLSEGEAA